MPSQVNDSEREQGTVSSDARSTPRSAYGKTHFAGFPICVRFPLYAVAIDLRLLRIRLEHGADGVVSGKLWQVHHCRLHELAVDLGAVAVLRDVALRQRQFFQEATLQIGIENLPGNLHHAARVLNYLYGFYSRKLIKEPTAARVHEHSVPLQFQQLQHRSLVGSLEFARRLLLEEQLN